MRSTQLCWNSAIDSPHGLFLLLAAATPATFACLAWITPTDALYITVAMVVAAVLIGWPSYRFESDALVIRSGLLLKWRLPYSEIQDVSPCIDWRIAIAMSRRRVLVVLRPSSRGHVKRYWVSPKSRPAFLSALRSRLQA